MERYPCLTRNPGSEERWRGLRHSILFAKLDRSLAQTATRVKRIFSSPQPEIENNYFRKAQTPGCTRYIDVSIGAIINKVAVRNSMVLKNIDCVHDIRQGPDNIEPNSRRHCSSGRVAHDLGAKHK